MELAPIETVGRQAWDAFALASPEAWARHASFSLDFNLSLVPDACDLSFAVITEGKIIAIAPLIKQAIDAGGYEFAAGGSATPFPALAPGLSTEERAQILTVIFSHIDTLARNEGIIRARFFVDPLSEPVYSGRLRDNPLLAYGYSDTSLVTVCIDLAPNEEQILAEIQGRRQRYIKSAERAGVYRIDFFTGPSATPAVFARFEELYSAAAGRVVGTQERWKETFNLLADGHALLALVSEAGKDEVAAGHFVSIYKKRAYDGLSAIRPEAKSNEVGNLMQWETIRHLKAQGYTHYEIGLLWPSEDSSYSPKEHAISHYKSLFGGLRLPVYRGVKNY